MPGVRFLPFAMAYVPNDAKWYLAWLVLEIIVEDDPRNIVHINLMLIRADSPGEAYEKAIELGKESEISYENPDGKSVVHVFRGIRDLNVIHDELEHGAELNYEENVGVSNEKIERMLRPRSEHGRCYIRTTPHGRSFSLMKEFSAQRFSTTCATQSKTTDR
jgi:hypothetical protein